MVLANPTYNQCTRVQSWLVKLLVLLACGITSWLVKLLVLLPGPIMTLRLSQLFCQQHRTHTECNQAFLAGLFIYKPYTH
jgi:hypothetical protein